MIGSESIESEEAIMSLSGMFAIIALCFFDSFTVLPSPREKTSSHRRDNGLNETQTIPRHRPLCYLASDFMGMSRVKFNIAGFAFLSLYKTMLVKTVPLIHPSRTIYTLPTISDLAYNIDSSNP
jgi:hypothetical protein